MLNETSASFPACRTPRVPRGEASLGGRWTFPSAVKPERFPSTQGRSTETGVSSLSLSVMVAAAALPSTSEV